MKWLLTVLLAIPTVAHAQWMERVVDRVHYRDPFYVPREWQRPDDPIIGEMWFLVSDYGSACRVTAEEWVMAHDDQYVCKWRRPR